MVAGMKKLNFLPLIMIVLLACQVGQVEPVTPAAATPSLTPTLGGQTALNLVMDLVEAGVLDRYGVELIGADAEAIATAEDRERFKVCRRPDCPWRYHPGSKWHVCGDAD